MVSEKLWIIWEKKLYLFYVLVSSHKVDNYFLNTKIQKIYIFMNTKFHSKKKKMYSIRIPTSKIHSIRIQNIFVIVWPNTT